jgi:DNA-directed RNA polymerase specialized sigma24 family protein
VLSRVACSNLAHRLVVLYRRWSELGSGSPGVVSETVFEDSRGVCVSRLGNAQTRLRPDEVEAMLDDYCSGMTQKAVAEKYEVYPATVGSHARGHGRVPPPSVTSEVLAEYAAGVPAGELAKRCGVSRDTVLRHAKSAGVRAPAKTVAPEVVAQVVGLYAEGVTLAQIGRRLGIGHRGARRVLVGAGVGIRPKGHRPPLEGRREVVFRLRGEGWSFARIADRLEVNKSTVRDFVARSG